MKQIIPVLFTIILTSLMSSLFGCTSKPGPLGEGTIKLDDFDFTTPISVIFPDRYIDPEFGYDGWYRVPSIPSTLGDYTLYRRNTCFNFFRDKALWITYQRQSLCPADEYLSMAGRSFPAANFATTFDGRIFAVGGTISELTQAGSDNFIARLNKQYGKPVHTLESFCSRKYDLYTWTQEDRTLKYAAVTTDEHNVLKFEHVYNEDGSLADICEGKRRNILQSYFFVIDAAWRDRFLITDRAVSGDITQCVGVYRFCIAMRVGIFHPQR